MKRRFIFDIAFIFHIVVLFILLVLFFAVKNLPLLSTLGFESANLLVTALGPLFGLAATLNRREKFVAIFAKEMLWLAIYVTVWCFLLTINGFYHASCSQGAGLASFLIIAVPPLLLNLSIGTMVATLIGNNALKILIFFLGLGIYYALVLWRFSQELSFRILTHASFLMSKDLLAGDELSAAIMAFRASTLLLALALVLIGINLLNQEPIGGRKNKVFWLNVSLIITIFLAHLVLQSQSLNALGKSRADLLHDYRLLAEKNHIKIWGDPTKTSLENAQAILEEALFFQEKLTMRLGKLSDAPVTIWLHKTESDKFLYTGAENVHFALPKAREIHIADFASPHPVLGHELAHIYVGEFSKTFFGLPGSGWIMPNLALTEGLAMVLTKELSVHNGLSLLEQAQALYQAKLIVNIEELFSANPIHFVELNPHISYIYAGAFLDFLLRDIPEPEQAKKLGALIESGDLKKFGKNTFDLATMQQAFTKKLKEPIAQEAIYWAKKSFHKDSILLLDCRRNMLNEKARVNEAILNHNSAQIRQLIPYFHEAKTKTTLVSRAIDAFLLEGAFLEALDLIAFWEENESQSIFLSQIRLKKLDTLINLARLHDAKLLINKIKDQNFSPPERRLLTIASLLLNDSDAGAKERALKKAALVYLFAKPANREIAIARFFFHFGQQQLRNNNQLSIYQYLMARMYLHNSSDALAYEAMQSLIRQKDKLAFLLQRETEMMWAIINAKLGHHDVALTTFHALLGTSQHEGEILSIKDHIDRIRFKSNNLSAHSSLPLESSQ